MSWRLKDKLVLDIPLNNHTRDVSGNLNHGTWGGIEAYTEGPFGHSVGVFNGGNTHVNVPNKPSLEIANELTVAFWSNLTAIQSADNWINRYSDANFGGNAYGFAVRMVTGPDRIQFGLVLDGVSTTLTAIGLLAKSDQHIICTYDGLFMVIYLNGKYASSAAASGTILTGIDADLSIGSATPTGGEITGKMWNNRILNVGLTYDEVIKLNRTDKY